MWDCINPSEGLRYKMTLEYLAVLAGLMAKRASAIIGGSDDGEVEEQLTP